MAAEKAEKGKREVPVQEIPARRATADTEDLSYAARRFLSSLLKAGANLAMIPINVLPRESRSHFRAAGREVTRGVASLTRQMANRLDEMADEPKSPTR
jgi:hypothetical protein